VAAGRIISFAGIAKLLGGGATTEVVHAVEMNVILAGSCASVGLVADDASCCGPLSRCLNLGERTHAINAFSHDLDPDRAPSDFRSSQTSRPIEQWRRMALARLDPSSLRKPVSTTVAMVAIGIENPRGERLRRVRRSNCQW